MRMPLMRRNDILNERMMVLILVPLVITTLYVLIPKDHVIEGEVLRTDCYQGFSVQPIVVINTSVRKESFYSSRADCVLLSTEIGNTVRLLVNGDVIKEVLA